MTLDEFKEALIEAGNQLTEAYNAILAEHKSVLFDEHDVPTEIHDQLKAGVEAVSTLILSMHIGEVEFDS